MNDETALTHLLRWRETRAASDAPPAPRAARLLARSRPWWAAFPEQFAQLMRQLDTVRVSYGHAMETARPASPAPRVPVMLAETAAERPALAEVVYFVVRDDRLTLRFLLAADPVPAVQAWEATLVAGDSPQPLLLAEARPAAGGEHRIDADLPADLAAAWRELRVTDRMPFRLILRASAPA